MNRKRKHIRGFRNLVLKKIEEMKWKERKKNKKKHQMQQIVMKFAKQYEKVMTYRSDTVETQR